MNRLRFPLPDDRRGLTLIELMLTLTILALAGTLVSGALVTGLRAWQSGMRSGREELVARIVLERVAGQLRAAVSSPAKRNDEDAVAFDVADDRLHFVTLATGGQAPVQVSYGMRGNGGNPGLVYREYPWPDKEFFGDGRPIREEKIAEITGFTVKVVKRSEKTSEGDAPPSTEWSPRDKVLPASVSVEIVVGAEGRPESRHFQTSVTIPTEKVP